MSDEVTFRFYVKGKLPGNLELPCELLGVEKVIDDWHKLTVRISREKIQSVAETLRRMGLRLAESPHYRLI